jgi:hypothetical protein
MAVIEETNDYVVLVNIKPDKLEDEINDHPDHRVISVTPSIRSRGVIDDIGGIEEEVTAYTLILEPLDEWEEDNWNDNDVIDTGIYG